MRNLNNNGCQRVIVVVCFIMVDGFGILFRDLPIEMASWAAISDISWARISLTSLSIWGECLPSCEL